MTVLGIGVSTIDCLCELDHYPMPDEKCRAKDFCFDGGGNAANSLVALSRLGYQTKILSRIGHDALGKECLALFHKEGIDTSLLQIDEAPTPFSIVLVDSSKHTRTIIHCTKAAPITYTYSPAHLESVQLVYADGRHIDAYAELLLQAQAQGIRIAIEAERKNLSADRYFPLANIVFASEQFHREFFGSEDYEANLQAIVALGPQIAVTTLGAKGALIKTKEELLFVKAPPITPVDTTGAGDAFNAAFLATFLKGYSLEMIAEFACHYAAEACQALGPRAGLKKVGLTSTSS